MNNLAAMKQEQLFLTDARNSHDDMWSDPQREAHWVEVVIVDDNIEKLVAQGKSEWIF